MTQPINSQLSRISLWHDLTQHLVTKRTQLDSDLDIDVAIVGGGFSGLWTAYYLKQLQPDARIAIFEANQVGFGASGRNGGWCTGLLPLSLDELAQEHGRQQAINMFRESFSTIGEVKRVIDHENIDCDFDHGGTINGATNPVQENRVSLAVKRMHAYGFTEDDLRMLSPTESTQRLKINGLVSSSYTPHCAALHPTKLVFGVARAVEKLGIAIYENSRVDQIGKRKLKLGQLTVQAQIIVRATEGYTPKIDGYRRNIVPLYSYMVATEPMSEAQRAEIGWQNRETYHDERNLIIYVQITKDFRIAFGGRGAPYHLGSRIKPEYDTHHVIHQRIIDSMHDVFPVSRSLEISHRWGGPLGVHRNWHPSVNFDQRTGMASLGGYVGDGVASTNLAGRTLAHLITGDNHPLTELPWVNHASRKWEIEPLRYIGVNGLLHLSAGMDRHEINTGKPDKLRSAILNRFI